LREKQHGELSHHDETALYRQYGLDYSESRSDRGLPEGEPAEGRDGVRGTDDGIKR
jgi:hypothetical protein